VEELDVEVEEIVVVGVVVFFSQLIVHKENIKITNKVKLFLCIIYLPTGIDCVCSRRLTIRTEIYPNYKCI